MENQQTDNLQSSNASIDPVSDSATAGATAPSQTAMASEPAPAETSMAESQPVVEAPAEIPVNPPNAPSTTFDAAPAASPVYDVPAAGPEPVEAASPSSVPDASPAKTEEFSPLPPPPHKGEGIEKDPPSLPSPAAIPDASPPATTKSNAPAYNSPQPPLNIREGEGAIGALLTKARAAIQGRKQKKLLKILALMEQKNKIKNEDVCKALRVSSATATRYLDELEKQGKVRQVGKRAGSFYEFNR